MKLKNIALILSFSLMVFLLSGCMQYKADLELKSNNTGKMTVCVAVNTDMFGAEDAQYNTSVEELENIDMEGVEVKTEPVQYEDNGYTFEGKKIEITFNDAEKFFRECPKNENGEDGMKFIDLPNGNKRLELYMYVDAEEDDESSEDSANSFSSSSIWGIMASTGGKINYTIKTDYNVVNHNADSVKNGVYTWDLLKKAMDPNNAGKKLTFFIEYTPKGNTSSTPINTAEKNEKRANVLEKLEIIKDSYDFYGEALYKLGILKGTGNGLELDKPLTRVEGAIMYSRLLNLDTEIEKFEKENPYYNSGFTDVPKWAKPTINYLHYKKLVAGIGGNKYGSNELMTETQYATLVLRALGYDDSKGDFTWDRAAEKLKEIGFYNDDTVKPEEILKGSFIRRGMSYISYNALFFPNKTTGRLLIDSLIEQ